jgi:hypothetical protein
MWLWAPPQLIVADHQAKAIPAASELEIDRREQLRES